jgi:hypothetical protein
MAQLHVVGIRHHSPACARLVRHVIGTVRPRYVLIEGPSDMNARIGELALGHELPIAIFSYAQGPRSRHASWSPFCAYSPEWVALESAREVGAEALFVDLPAWHEAFDEVKNRYSTRHERASARMTALCERLGVEDTDTLWDHLFEQPLPPATLAERLTTYFHELRDGDDPGSRDRAREAYMSRWIAWALNENAGHVVVVCGGYHEPELRRGHHAVREASRPEVPQLDPDTRFGSYVVPYSFHRLDAFVGYESGMPSPEFYQRVWDLGADAAGEEMLFRAITHLREKKQRVSSADAIAALTLARGLSTLRGHASLARVDVLDGLAAAVVKEALDAPLPWNRRGTLVRGTDRMLAEMVIAFSGTRVGKLARNTPRPPLLADVMVELDRVGVVLGPLLWDFAGPKTSKVKASLNDPAGLARSRVLHRIRVLGVPGFSLTRAPSLARNETNLDETWAVNAALETEAALIEASALGATLESAAAAKLEERIAEAPGLGALARLLQDAALVGIDTVTMRLVDDVRRIAGNEPEFGELGAALGVLLALFRHDVLLGTAGAPMVGAAVAAAFERGLWLYEGLSGGVLDARSSSAVVAGAVALRDALRYAGATLSLDGARAEAVMQRCLAQHDAPPAVRGAAMGFLWSMRVAMGEQETTMAVHSAARPATLGDFLAGLFALAREEVLHTPSLLAVIDALVSTMTRSDFLIAIPSLRMAFGYFPPREKELIANHALALAGKPTGDARSLLRLEVDAGLTMHGMQLDAEIVKRARRYGLTDDGDP